MEMMTSRFFCFTPRPIEKFRDSAIFVAEEGQGLGSEHIDSVSINPQSRYVVILALLQMIKGG
jgi:hypothetical protein